MPSIQRPSDAAGELVYRVAAAAWSIPAQLSIAADDCVVAARDGAVIAVVPPGDHVADPLAGAELWFVWTKPWQGVRFGGPIGAMVDPATQVRCTPRIFGEYGIAIGDPARFVTACGVTAADAAPILAWVSQTVLAQLGGAIATAVAGGKSVIAPDLAVAAQAPVTAAIAAALAPFGIAFTRFGDVQVSLLDADVAALKQAAKARAEAKRAAAAPSCPRCGAPAGAGRFCGQCGAPLA